jgi:excisionase family DNA binding protein
MAAAIRSGTRRRRATPTFNLFQLGLSMSALQNQAMLPEVRRALRINEVCKAYGVSRSTVYKLAKEGKLRLSKIGGRSLIRVDDAEALLNGEGAR